MSMYDMVDTTPEGYSEGEELSKMFSEDDMSEAFEERDIDVITEEINFYKQQAGMAILEIGKRLVEAKAQLSHGEWLPWLEKKVEFSERSAQQYIRLWKEYGKSATVADLGVRKALVLLALPESEREGFAGETHAVNGEEKTVSDMTVKELEKAIADGFPVAGELRFVLRNGELDATPPQELLATATACPPRYDCAKGEPVAP